MKSQKHKESIKSEDRPDESLARRAPDDPSRAPEEEGSATQTSNKQQLLNEHRTDESGAPDDD
ncbi:MAG: hypothetical protein ACTHN5_11465 [Phycisphaerae bacterium]